MFDFQGLMAWVPSCLTTSTSDILVQVAESGVARNGTAHYIKDIASKIPSNVYYKLCPEVRRLVSESLCWVEKGWNVERSAKISTYVAEKTSLSPTAVAACAAAVVGGSLLFMYGKRKLWDKAELEPEPKTKSRSRSEVNHRPVTRSMTRATAGAPLRY